MKDPDAVADSVGEWFEVFNNTKLIVDLEGLVVEDASGETFTVVGYLPMASYDYLVFGLEDDSTLNGDLTVDYEYTGMTLDNGADDIGLYNGSTLIDEVVFDDGTNWPDLTGYALALDPWNWPDATLNDDYAEWCDATVSFGDGDYGSPGIGNDMCVSSTKTDVDGDGYDDIAYGGTDCNDIDPGCHPGAAPNEADPTLCHCDADGDDWGGDTVPKGVDAGTDCDDADSNVNPGATETPGDGTDSNCDGNDNT